MSEFKELTLSPELIEVDDKSSQTPPGKSQLSANEPERNSGKHDTAIGQSSESSASPAHSSSSSASKQSPPTASNNDNTDNQLSIHEFEQNRRPMDKEKSGPQKSHDFRRHRSIFWACMGISASIVAFAAVDLRPLLSQTGFIDKTGHLTLQKPRPDLGPNFSYLPGKEGSEGLIPIVESRWDEDAYGFVDENGKLAIKPKFGTSYDFHEGLALASPLGKSQKFGYINKKGKWAIKPIYSQALEFKNGMTAVTLDGKWSLIDSKGNILRQHTDSTYRTPAPIGKGFLDYGPDGLVGVVGNTGKWILPAEYTAITEVHPRDDYYLRRLIMYSDTSKASDRYLVLNKNQKFGIADTDGKILIPPRYDAIKSYQDGHVVFQQNKTPETEQSTSISYPVRSDTSLYGMAKADGSILFEPKYDVITPYADLIALKKDGQWTFASKNGETIPTAKIDGIITNANGEWFNNGLGPVIINDKCAYMNQKGQIAFQRNFDFASPFQEGYAAVWDGKWWRFIDTSGNYAFGKKFTKLELLANGKARVTKPGILYPLLQGKDSEEMSRYSKDFIENAKSRNDF